MQKQIDLQVTLDELNLVLVALGQLPYAQVHELIARLQVDIVPQLVTDAAAGTAGSAETARTGR